MAARLPCSCLPGDLVLAGEETIAGRRVVLVREGRTPNGLIAQQRLEHRRRRRPRMRLRESPASSCKKQSYQILTIQQATSTPRTKPRTHSLLSCALISWAPTSAELGPAVGIAYNEGWCSRRMPCKRLPNISTSDHSNIIKFKHNRKMHPPSPFYLLENI